MSTTNLTEVFEPRETPDPASNIRPVECGCMYFTWRPRPNSTIDVTVSQDDLDQSLHLIADAVQNVDPSNNTVVPIDNGQNENQETMQNENQDPSEWQEEYFKRFAWLNEPPNDFDEDTFANLLSNPIDDTMMTKGLEYFEKIADQLTKQMLSQEQTLLKSKVPDEKSKVPDVKSKVSDAKSTKLYLYFVSLEGSKMLLHSSYKRTYEDVLKDCTKLYEYAKLHEPIKVVYEIENIDFYDVDKYVKLFMNMFGLDETRGGSYTDVILPDYMKQTLMREFQIVSLEHYEKQKARLADDASQLA